MIDKIDEFNEINSSIEFCSSNSSEYFRITDNETSKVKEQAKINEVGSTSSNSNEQVTTMRYSNEKKDNEVKQKKLDTNIFQKMISLFLVAAVSVPVIGELILTSGKINLLHISPSTTSIYYELEVIDYEGKAYINLFNDFISQTNELTGEVVIRDEGTEKESTVILCQGSFVDLKPEITYNVTIVTGEGLSQTIHESFSITTLKEEGVSSFYSASISDNGDASLRVNLSFDDYDNKWDSFFLILNTGTNAFEHTLSKDYEQILTLEWYEYEELMHSECEFTVLSMMGDNEEHLYSGKFRLQTLESTVYDVTISDANNLNVRVNISFEDYDNLWDSFKLVLKFNDEEFNYDLNKDYENIIQVNDVLYQMLNNNVIPYELYAKTQNDEVLVKTGSVTLSSKMTMFYISEFIYDNTASVDMEYDENYGFQGFSLVLQNENTSKTFDLSTEHYQNITFSDNETGLFIGVVTYYEVYGITSEDSELVYTGEVTFMLEESHVYSMEVSDIINYNEGLDKYYLSLHINYSDPGSVYTNPILSISNSNISFDINLDSLNIETIYLDDINIEDLLNITSYITLLNNNEELYQISLGFTYNSANSYSFNSITIESVISNQNAISVTLDYSDPNEEIEYFLIVFSYNNDSNLFTVGKELKSEIAIGDLALEYNGNTIDYTLYAVVNSENNYLDSGSVAFTKALSDGYILNATISPAIQLDDTNNEFYVNLTMEYDDPDETFTNLVLTIENDNINSTYAIERLESQKVYLGDIDIEMLISSEVAFTINLNDKELYYGLTTLYYSNITYVFNSIEFTGTITFDNLVYYTLDYSDPNENISYFILRLNTDSNNLEFELTKDTESMLVLDYDTADIMKESTVSYTLYALLYGDEVELTSGTQYFEKEIVEPTFNYMIVDNILTSLDLPITLSYYDPSDLWDLFFIQIVISDLDFDEQFDIEKTENQLVHLPFDYVTDLEGRSADITLYAYRNQENITLDALNVTFELSDPMVTRFEIFETIGSDFIVNLALELNDTNNNWEEFNLVLTSADNSISFSTQLSNEVEQWFEIPEEYRDSINGTTFNYVLYNITNNANDEVFSGTVTFAQTPLLISLTIDDTIIENQAGGYFINVTMDYVDLYNEWGVLYILFLDGDMNEIVSVDVEEQESQQIQIEQAYIELLTSGELTYEFYVKYGSESELLTSGQITFKQ